MPDDLPELDRGRVALVLGAGGVVGSAYHAGALLSLEHHTSWDPRSASLVVGTSAGALVGGLLRVGASTEDLVWMSRKVRDNLDASWVPMVESSDATLPGPVEVMLALRPPTAGSLMRSVLRRSLWPAVLSSARRGTLALEPLLAHLDHLSDGEWPVARLAICAAASDDGQRTVIDASDGLSLSNAVAASCSVPGLFAPEATRRLVDGGVHSTTNADIGFADDIDVTIVVAPMAGSLFQGPLTASFACTIERKLRREIDGRPCLVVAPSPRSARAMGMSLMSDRHLDDCVLAGFLDMGDALAGIHQSGV